MKRFNQNHQFNKFDQGIHMKVNPGKTKQSKRPFTKQPDYIQLSNVVKDCIKKNMRKSSSNHIAIVENIEDGAIVSAKQTKIKRVFEQLISTAIKYSPAGSILNITLKTDHDKILFKIQDSRINLNDINLKDIVKLHGNLNWNITGGKGTTEPGLLIAQSIIELYKGNIWIIRNGAIKASNFIVEYPIQQKPNYRKELPKLNRMA